MEAMPDKDPLETTDWLDALQAVQQHRGAERANYLLTRLVEGARRMGDYVPPALTTAYCNTIPADREAKSPGDRAIEHRIRSAIRWNAVAIILRANKELVRTGRPYRKLSVFRAPVRHRLGPLLACSYGAARRRSDLCAGPCFTWRIRSGLH